MRLSACGVKDWILVSAQISERLFIEESALQFTVVGQQELSRERLQFSISTSVLKSFARCRAAASSPAATTTQLPFRSRRTNSVIYSPTECYANRTEAVSVVNTSPSIVVNVREGRWFPQQRR